MPFADPIVEYEYHKAYCRKWAKERADRLRAAGFCVQCGVEPVTKFRKCAKCRAMLMQSYHRTKLVDMRQCTDCSQWTVNKNTKGTRCKACNGRRANATRWGHPYVPVSPIT